MNVQHKNLAAGRWNDMPLTEQMANIGSEVGRAIKWRNKNKKDLSDKAFIRALELLDLSMSSMKRFPRIKELARLREALVDYFHGDNEFSSTEASWNNYFGHFNYIVRRSR